MIENDGENLKTSACGAGRRRRQKIFEIWSIFLFLRQFFVSYSPSGGRAADGPEAPLEKIFCYWFVNFKICEIIFNEIFKNVSTSKLAQP